MQVLRLHDEKVLKVNSFWSDVRLLLYSRCTTLQHTYVHKMYYNPFFSFNGRHSTMHKCGDTGPCLSGGEPSGVCCQRQLCVVCEGVNVHTCKQNVLTVSVMVCVTGLVQV